ncbi:MAG: copper homeostasis protein CutC [Gemmatimonadaceae bacterium]|nr:copper homeostasis protein CutC [Gemmatimonadaceae bacterium]
MSGRPLVEACVEGIEAAAAADRAGDDRLELCASLVEDGTTPSAGTLAVARSRVAIPIVAMVRPRGGGFVYSSAELEVMERDVAAAREAGAAGIATGALTEDGRVNEEALRALVRAAGSLPVTFHRAFDHVADPAAALETLITLGARRVLTSGGASSARAGIDTLAALGRQAGDRIAIVAGGHVDAAAARDLVAAGIRELHVGNDRARLASVIAVVRAAAR